MNLFLVSYHRGHQQEEQFIEKEPWAPMKLPASTFALDDRDEVLPREAVRQWPEFRLMEEDDVIVTIEYCTKCEEHENSTRHDEEEYLDVAEKAKTLLTELARQYAVRYAVILKPARHKHVNMFKKAAARIAPGLQPNVLGLDYTIRLGALEIQVRLSVVWNGEFYILSYTRYKMLSWFSLVYNCLV